MKFQGCLVKTVGLASIAFLVACSTTGFSTKSDVIAPRIVKAPSSVNPEVIPYLPRLVDALQKAGFIVGKTDNPNALELKLEFNPNPFNMRVSASLWQDGVPLLSASATNPGWGTAMARGAVVNSLADSVINKFQVEVASLSSRLTIKEPMRLIPRKKTK